MKTYLTILLICLSSITIGQTYNVSVIDGYGSGSFSVGDTVNVWAKEMDSTTTFLTWSGDTNISGFLNEWHTSFIMPPQNVNLQAQFNVVATLDFEHIQCADTIKPVYHYFPPSPNGLAFLFHGSSGNMDSWILSPDNFQFVKDLIANNIAIVITEAEEVTRNIDIDGDGIHRWIKDSLSFSNNIDIRNIQTLIDTFENRGVISSSTERFAIGMSNGGSFSSAVSYVLSFNAAVSYCSRGNITAVTNTTTPTLWCMAKYDDNPNVGYSAYLNTLVFSTNLNSNNVCSNVYLKDKSPIYPEIFARYPTISTSLSQDIFNELNTFGLLDSIGNYYYMNTFSDSIISQVATYPILSSLSIYQLLAVSSQMDVTHAGHKFFSSHNKRTIDFLFNPCSTTLSLNEKHKKKPTLVYPNPALDIVYIKINSVLLDKTILLFNNFGQLVQEDEMNSLIKTIDISHLRNGVYLLKVNGEVKKIIKN